VYHSSVPCISMLHWLRRVHSSIEHSIVHHASCIVHRREQLPLPHPAAPRRCRTQHPLSLLHPPASHRTRNSMLEPLQGGKLVGAGGAAQGNTRINEEFPGINQQVLISWVFIWASIFLLLDFIFLQLGNGPLGAFGDSACVAPMRRGVLFVRRVCHGANKLPMMS
jgi:hypothetical protein